jgi:hypothetical protein
MVHHKRRYPRWCMATHPPYWTRGDGGRIGGETSRHIAGEVADWPLKALTRLAGEERWLMADGRLLDEVFWLIGHLPMCMRWRMANGEMAK